MSLVRDYSKEVDIESQYDSSVLKASSNSLQANISLSSPSKYTEGKKEEDKKY